VLSSKKLSNSVPVVFGFNSTLSELVSKFTDFGFSGEISQCFDPEFCKKVRAELESVDGWKEMTTYDAQNEYR
jgi:hypothetical protein